MTASRVRYRTAVAIMAGWLSIVGLATGCANPFSESKDDNVQTIVEADTKKAVDQYARHVAEVAGAELTRYETNSAPCTGRLGENSTDVYTTQGSGQIFVPQTRHAGILAELREQWKAQGYTVETDRRMPAETGNELAVRTPDGFRIRLIDTEPPVALSLLINSPCRRSPTPMY